MTKEKFRKIIKQIQIGFLNGLGFSIGVTVGIAIVSTILINVIGLGNGLPVVGGMFAAIVEATQKEIDAR